MNRRLFLQRSGGLLLGSTLFSRCGLTRAQWREVRLVSGEEATKLELEALRDGSGLLERAIGTSIPVVRESSSWRRADVLVGCPESSRSLQSLALPFSRAGAFRISSRPDAGSPWITIAGTDAEGARNGLYYFLEHLGFGFFRDGETVPSLKGPIDSSSPFDLRRRPAFSWRGDMIWDNYLGPRRYCAAVWGEAEWERALLYLARKGLNFLEFYPPLEHVLSLAFPEAGGLSEGSVWKSEAKHEMAKKVLARGRSLGIRFMYVLSYGAFPEPIRELYPHLEWAKGFLCAHQPELAEMSQRTWRVLVGEFGTDHLYAIRHRGEEDQSYSDPCRSITKAEGFRQAISVVEKLDPQAAITVWTWGEKLPELFSELPSRVHAAHIRHGMANVFGERGEGREQADGRPDLPPGRRWLSGQFTVFGGNEAFAQTAWCDGAALARDALASMKDESCKGYFQWPEWSNTSPWLSEVIAALSWNPASMSSPEE
ncbi:MAG: alpha-N-acetylglucosaminidase TIM-barrel domain-containing protein, partial [Acidobacteriota bacterium]